MVKPLLTLLFALCMSHSTAIAQSAAAPFTINDSRVVPIASKHTGRKHELVIVLPASYKSSPTKKYPVFYYLDAYWDTPLVAATYGNLIYDNQIPEMILVGLSYPSGANYGAERGIDYTPSAAGNGSGKGKQFLEFIKQEVAPLIESQYRGLPTDRIIGGSSLAGLFAISAAYMAPDFFAGHIAISPAVMWDKETLFRTDSEYAKAGKPLNSRMFVSYGAAEHPAFREPIVRFQQQLSKRAYSGFALQNFAMEGLEHAGVKGDGYARGLIWVWQNKKPAGPSGLDQGFGPRK